MTNGLDDLDRQRARQRSARARSIPPSRHPAADQPATSDHQQTEVVPPVPIRADPGPSPVAQPQPPVSVLDVVADPPAATSPPAGGGELVRTTLHLSPAEDEFLEAVRTAGRGRRPRVDTSRSAVARYAIDQLAARMTAEQIVTALEQSTQPMSSTGGRPRR